jgi:hypothetical protein
MSSAAGGIMFSDSQVSAVAADEEGYGVQKQFCGPDFLVGFSGDLIVIDAILHRLSLLASQRGAHLSSSNVQSVIQGYLETEVRPEAARVNPILLVTPDPEHVMVSKYLPNYFRSFGRRYSFDAIGSGAAFVFRAYVRDLAVGIERGSASLVDMFVKTYDYAGVASQSLTVDDRFFVGFVVGNRSYCMGHRSIYPVHGPQALRDVWPEASDRFDEISGMVRTIHGELRNAQRAFSSLATGTLDEKRQRRIEESRASIREHRARLKKALRDYFRWYDRVLGRAALGARA